MNILVTGSEGFVGKNFICALKQIINKNDKLHLNISIDKIFEYNRKSTNEDLNKFCKECDFVFHFLGVNRPKNVDEFFDGNVNFTKKLLLCLKKYNNNSPIVFSSSVQAFLSGRFSNSIYGESKLKAENLIFEYCKENNIDSYVYRFPNIFGKWSKPNYNSAIATFCYNIANDIEVVVNNNSTELDLLYIDDLINIMLDILSLKIRPSLEYIIPKNIYKKKIGEIVNDLYRFKSERKTFLIPSIVGGSFESKLFSTYISYLPKEKLITDCISKSDERGSFTELVKLETGGQFSVNIIKPNSTKGMHFHHSKWEYFIVIKGKALVEERKVTDDCADNKFKFIVDDTHIKKICMAPGNTHSITNLSDKDELILLIWSNEIFDPRQPDTFCEEV